MLQLFGLFQIENHAVAVQGNVYKKEQGKLDTLEKNGGDDLLNLCFRR